MQVLHLAQKVTLLILVGSCLHGHGAPKFGPYKSFIDRVGTCKILSHPAVKNPPVSMHVEVYNTTSKSFLLRGNFNVTKETRNISLRVKCFAWMNGKWKINYIISSMPCHGTMLTLVMTFFSIPFNPKKCALPKAVNQFENVNVDELRHKISSVAEYGRMLFRVEMLSKSMQTFYCWEFESQVIPDK